MSEPEAALANPMPAFIAASCFSRSLFYFVFLRRRKARCAPVGRINHMAGKDDQLWNGETFVESVRLSVEMPRQGPGLPSGGRKGPQIITFRRDRCFICLFRSLGVAQDNQGFRDRCVLPIIVWLCPANLEDCLGYVFRLFSFSEQESDRSGVNSRGTTRR